MEQEHTDASLILFDGLCHLCNNSVIFIIERDPDKQFKFVSLQSTAGQRLLERYGLPLDKLDTFFLIEAGKIYNRSTAALKVIKRLNGLWPILYAFIIVPRPVRDFVYNFIASNRYKVFGKRETCMVPTSDMKDPLSREFCFRRL